MGFRERTLPALIASALALWPGDSGATDDIRASFQARESALDKTQGLVDRKLDVRISDMRRRVGALYKAMRGAQAKAWFDLGERAAIARRRAAARWILRRDLSEIELLRKELSLARAAESRLASMLSRAKAVSPPAARSLLLPATGAVIVSRFGPFVGKRSGTQLTRRGIDLQVAPKASVRAPAAGRVRYAGPLRGLEQAVVIAHRGYFTVIGHMSVIVVDRGQPVARGEKLGAAGANSLYLEVRLDTGAGGHPVDPEPLLSPR